MYIALKHPSRGRLVPAALPWLFQVWRAALPNPKKVGADVHGDVVQGGGPGDTGECNRKSGYRILLQDLRKPDFSAIFAIPSQTLRTPRRVKLLVTAAFDDSTRAVMTSCGSPLTRAAIIPNIMREKKIVFIAGPPFIPCIQLKGGVYAFFHRNMGAGKGDALLPFLCKRTAAGKENPAGGRAFLFQLIRNRSGRKDFCPCNRWFQAAVNSGPPPSIRAAVFSGREVAVTGGQLREILQISGGRPAAAEGQGPGVSCFYQLGVAPVPEKWKRAGGFLLVPADDGSNSGLSGNGGLRRAGAWHPDPGGRCAEKVFYFPAVFFIGQEAVTPGLIRESVFFCWSI